MGEDRERRTWVARQMSKERKISICILRERKSERECDDLERWRENEVRKMERERDMRTETNKYM